jgi:hypothetical protein
VLWKSNSSAFVHLGTLGLEAAHAVHLRNDLGWESDHNVPTHLPLFLLRTKVCRLGSQTVRLTLTRRNLLESLHTESANHLLGRM